MQSQMIIPVSFVSSLCFYFKLKQLKTRSNVATCQLHHRRCYQKEMKFKWSQGKLGYAAESDNFKTSMVYYNNYLHAYCLSYAHCVS